AYKNEDEKTTGAGTEKAIVKTNGSTYQQAVYFLFGISKFRGMQAAKIFFNEGINCYQYKQHQYKRLKQVGINMAQCPCSQKRENKSRHCRRKYSQVIDLNAAHILHHCRCSTRNRSQLACTKCCCQRYSR